LNVRCPSARTDRPGIGLFRRRAGLRTHDEEFEIHACFCWRTAGTFVAVAAPAFARYDRSPSRRRTGFRDAGCGWRDAVGDRGRDEDRGDVYCRVPSSIR
jgi:hypothetical protein